MPPDQDAENKFDQLREKAEALIRERPEQKTTPLPGILDLIHELHIHQAELAIQNEELQRAQQELSELHQEYENLYEFAPCGYLSLNSKGIIIRINLAGVTLLQAMRKQVLHTGFSQFLHADYEDIYLEALQKAGQTGEKQFIELRLARAEDSQFWVWAEIQADRCINDSVKQWLMTLVNISSKKQAESILQASNKKYQRLFHEMVGGALLLSVTIGTEKNYPLAASVLEANGAFERLTGVQSRQVVGRPMDEIWPLADTVWADQLCKALSAQTPIEINGPHREKSQQFFLSAFWVDDCQVGITFTDISAQKTIEWTLCEIRQDLARQVKEQTAELRRTFFNSYSGTYFGGVLVQIFTDCGKW
jgi:PAS domain-containing protein